jgi:hypothetical protein
VEVVVLFTKPFTTDRIVVIILVDCTNAHPIVRPSVRPSGAHETKLYRTPVPDINTTRARHWRRVHKTKSMHPLIEG